VLFSSPLGIVRPATSITTVHHSAPTGSVISTGPCMPWPHIIPVRHNVEPSAPLTGRHPLSPALHSRTTVLGTEVSYGDYTGTQQGAAATQLSPVSNHTLSRICDRVLRKAASSTERPALATQPEAALRSRSATMTRPAPRRSASPGPATVATLAHRLLAGPKARSTNIPSNDGLQVRLSIPVLAGPALGTASG
jgi:hypothetical protein